MTLNDRTRRSWAHVIGLTVPDVALAVHFFAGILGPSCVSTEPESAAPTIDVGPGVAVRLRAALENPNFALPPRIVDIGTNHLCFRVGDIDAAVQYLRDLPDVEILGDVITVPDGPIAGNRWIYFRSPWGTLFELQQWPTVPGYFAQTPVRLLHDQRPPADAVLPSLRGLDHSGYSVRNLSAAIDFLVDCHGAELALKTEISAGRDFMRAQLGTDVEGTSEMAMVVVGGILNIELFEHHVGEKHPSRPLDAFGGNYLALHTSSDRRPMPVGAGAARRSMSVLS